MFGSNKLKRRVSDLEDMVETQGKFIGELLNAQTVVFKAIENNTKLIVGLATAGKELTSALVEAKKMEAKLAKKSPPKETVQ